MHKAPRLGQEPSPLSEHVSSRSATARKPHISRRRIAALLALSALSLCMVGATCKRKMKKIDEYQRELWTAEADENLDRINQALIQQWKQANDKKSFTFPSAGPTPSQVPCGTRPEHPKAKLWEGNSWEKLGFSITKPFRYQYRVISSGKGKDAKFTIRAYGDLDCDGTWATYELWGAINKKGRVHNFGGKRFDEQNAAE
jgi:hypothetical protein